ncbi:MAG: ArsA family ATPase [Actinomycetota bacterium]
MLIDEFLAPKILIVSGKGGVGKTTVTAALALVAARRSRKVCIAEVDRKGTLPKLFGASKLDYEPSELLPGIWGLNIAPDKALEEYLGVQYHMRRISRVLTHSHFIDYIATAAPGLKDILVLGKVWYLEQGRAGGGSTHDFDTIVVDAPAAGHMRTFLSAPAGLSDAVRVGPIRRQSEWLLAMLRDARRSRIHLVTLAEEMPVAETLETSEALSGPLHMHQGVTFANAVYAEQLTRAQDNELQQMSVDGPPERLMLGAKQAGLKLDEEDVVELLAHARFLRARRSIQQRHLKNLRKGLDPAVVELPFLFSAGLELPDIEMLADAIEARVEKL